MPKLLTLDVVQARLASRGIRLVGGEYHGKRDRATFECEHGHVWNATIAPVLVGTGCPECDAITKRLDNVTIQSRLAGRGIRLVGEYRGKRVKSKFRCSSGHEWYAQAGSVIYGCGCPACGRESAVEKRKVPFEVVAELFSKRGFLIIGEYVDTNTPVMSRCQLGHEWTAIYTDVVRGRGCPYCADYGFNRNKDAVFYVLKVCGVHSDFTGFGITNTPKTRIATHKRKLSKHGFIIEDHVSIDGTGDEVLMLENTVKATFGCVPQEVEGFVTEATHSSKFNQVVQFARSFMELNHDL